MVKVHPYHMNSINYTSVQIICPLLTGGALPNQVSNTAV